MSGQKEEGLPVGRARRDSGKKFSELYSVGCVMKNLPIKLSVKSLLLTNASSERVLSGGCAEVLSPT